MMGLTLEPEVETRLRLAAERSGKTPDAYLNELLNDLLPAASPAPDPDHGAEPKTLADVFAGRTGGVHGGGHAFSENTGRAFADGMAARYGRKKG